MKKYILLIIFTFLSYGIQAQDEQQVTEIFIIDSYITQEKPYKLMLSFFTDDSTTSKVVINDKNEFVASTGLTDNHKVEIDISNIKFDSNFVHYYIVVKNSQGEESKSEIYEASLPFTIEGQASSSGNFLEFCMGGIIFSLPDPTIVVNDNKSFFSLKKEVPIFSYYSGGYNYPVSYISAEYQYIFEQKVNFFRIGYKHIFQIPVFEYLSPGLNGFTNFEGKNGLSPEVALGLFKVYNVFTVNLKYRYNIKLNETSYNFHEISIGLFSNFFSLNL